MKVFVLRAIFGLSITLGSIGVWIFGLSRTENVSNAIIHLSNAGHNGGAIASGLITCAGLYCLLQLEIVIMTKRIDKNDTPISNTEI